MAKSGITQSTFKDAIVKPASGSPDLTFEGPAHTAGEDFKINGQGLVIVVGDGHLPECLDYLEK